MKNSTSIASADKQSRLVDRYQRHLNYLRISITDRCNLRCLYCKPDGIIPKLAHNDILTYEEIIRLVKVAVGLGVTKVRITGGEPLVRKGIYAFLNELSQIKGLEDLSLTTNGVMLETYLDRIRAAGIKRLNISLDTLKPEKYAQITGRDTFKQVWEAIHRAHKLGFSPIKINVVALKGYNEDELTDMARLTIDYPFHVRFIEYMPIGLAQTKRDGLLKTTDIKEKISAIGPLLPVARGDQDGPAERFRIAGAAGEIGFISPMSNHFCHSCNRLRISASGQLRSCLLSDKQADLRRILRNGGSDKELVQVFLTSVQKKPAGHQITTNSKKVNSQMSTIGG